MPGVAMSASLLPHLYQGRAHHPSLHIPAWGTYDRDFLVKGVVIDLSFDLHSGQGNGRCVDHHAGRMERRVAVGLTWGHVGNFLHGMRATPCKQVEGNYEGIE